MKLIAANSNGTLAQAIADHLDTPLAQAEFKRFKDNEIFVEIQENVQAR
jgi:ribose-phosphate pyrophosphokinase